MIIIIIEEVDQQDRSTQSTDKTRDKKKTQKREKINRTFSTRTKQLIFYCRSLMTGLTLPNSIDATIIIIILN
jgi:hypothetical protein